MADTWERVQVPAPTTDKALTITGTALTEVAAVDIQKWDLTATIGGEVRLLGRVRAIPYTEANGKLKNPLKYKVEILSFASSANEIYAGDDTTPFTDSEADSVTVIGDMQLVELEAFHTQATDTYP